MSQERIKIDVEHGCIDRSTELGKKFAAFNDSLKDKPADEKEFMSKISAFVEASMIVENTLPKEEAEKAIAKLREQITADSPTK